MPSLGVKNATNKKCGERVGCDANGGIVRHHADGACECAAPILQRAESTKANGLLVVCW